MYLARRPKPDQPAPDQALGEALRQREAQVGAALVEAAIRRPRSRAASARMVVSTSGSSGMLPRCAPAARLSVRAPSRKRRANPAMTALREAVRAHDRPDRPSARPARRLLRLPGGAARGQGRAWSATCSRGSRARYDLMNDLMSGGVHRLWKAALIDWLAPRPGLRLLDVAGGTGDIAFRVLRPGRATGAAPRIVVCDVNRAMLEVGRDRALDAEPARRHRLAVRRCRGAAAARSQRRRLHDRLRHPQRHPDRPRAGRGAGACCGRAAASSASSSRTVPSPALRRALRRLLVQRGAVARRSASPATRRPTAIWSRASGASRTRRPSPRMIEQAGLEQRALSRPVRRHRGDPLGLASLGMRPCCATLRHVWRLIGIARCLARHNALFPLERLPLPDPALRLARRLSRQDAPGRPGQRLALALQELGPSFIKLGQSLATRSRPARPGARRRPVAAAGRPAAVRRRGRAPDDRGASWAGRSTSCSRASTSGRSPRPRSPRCISR